MPVGERFRAGDELWQRNAYSVAPFDREGGHAKVEALRQALRQPLVLSAAGGTDEFAALLRGTAAAGTPMSDDVLARPGEGLGRSAALKSACWDAMATVHDGQFKHGPDVAALGYVEDLRLHRFEQCEAGEEHGAAACEVEIVMTMPTAGRPMFMSIGLELQEAVLAVPGVRDVAVTRSDDDEGWSLACMDVSAQDAVLRAPARL